MALFTCISMKSYSGALVHGNTPAAQENLRDVKPCMRYAENPVDVTHLLRKRFIYYIYYISDSGLYMDFTPHVYFNLYLKTFSTFSFPFTPLVAVGAVQQN